MSETDSVRLRVFCDVCVPTYKTSTMVPVQIRSISPVGDVNPSDGYVCHDPSCGRQYTRMFGYRDAALDSPRKALAVFCRCDSDRPAMYIDHVREDGGVGFRCWLCGATKEAASPRAVWGQL